jgi:hypothetical protein
MKTFRARFNQREGTPDRALTPNPVKYYPTCDCLARSPKDGKCPERGLHAELQDKSSAAWEALEEYIRKVDVDGSDEFNPIDGIGAEYWRQIITLPPSIGMLQSVKVLMLYGSHLVRIPPEIGELKSLREFDPYTSYCLHWLPYEITRCKKLKRSRVSTRALYGNYKFRAPFPRLPDTAADVVPAACSVCRGPFPNGEIYQAWISLRVATDVLPLLVHACSMACLQKLPKGAPGYVQEPHQGGVGLSQPLPYCDDLQEFKRYTVNESAEFVRKTIR